MLNSDMHNIVLTGYIFIYKWVLGLIFWKVKKPMFLVLESKITELKHYYIVVN